MSKLKNFWDRLRKIKHIQIIVPLIIGVILVVAYFSFFAKPKSDNTQQNTTEEFSSSQEYVNALENKLINVLSKVSGAGQVNVAITLLCGFTYEYATDTETKTVSSGGTETTIKTETVILVSNEPVVVKQNYPVIKGVVIVAKGAQDFNVKMNILNACMTVLDIDSEDITILA